MASGIQVDLEWAGTDSGANRAQSHADAAPIAASNAAAAARFLTDEEILGIEPPSPNDGNGGRARVGGEPSARSALIPSEARSGFGTPVESTGLSSGSAGGTESRPRDSSGNFGPRNDNSSEEAAQPAGHESRFTLRQGSGEANHESDATAVMPGWMQAAASDPQHGGEAQQLWREHQEFRSAFASPEEARAIKELLPGGVRDVLSLWEATQSVERIDAALFSGDTRAQSEVVAELARVNPSAFRSLFAEAAKVLAELGAERTETRGREAGIQEAGSSRLEARIPLAPQTSPAPAFQASNRESQALDHQASGSSLQPLASNLQNFDPAAYATFERSTNDVVARDVRGSISDTLARVLPDGVADGAARRIGEDIFQEIHRALASDRTLSEQVAAVLRERRFGSGEQQQVASLLAGRARQLVPSVARRVIGEWTSSVLNTSRSKAARQAAAASRVDIAAPGGSLDSMPLRPGATGSPRGVDYASMTDEQILGI
jgi:hypothetical protein